MVWILSLVVLAAAPSRADDLTVRTDAGVVAGQEVEGRARAWLGLPYAAPPTGEQRWRAPAPVPAWTGAREARAFGPVCAQPGKDPTGRAIVDGVKTVKIFGEDIAVRAKIFTLGGFSGHADQNGLLKWLLNFKNKKMQVFVVHGEEKSALAFAEKIREKKKLQVTVPELGQKIKL